MMYRFNFLGAEETEPVLHVFIGYLVVLCRDGRMFLRTDYLSFDNACEHIYSSYNSFSLL